MSTRQGSPSRQPSPKSDGPVFVEPDRPRLKPGVREMLCEQAIIEEKFGRRVAKLTFLDPLSGERVCFYVNVLSTLGCKYHEAWTIAFGGPPKSRQVMSVRVFKGKFFEIEIGETTRT